MDINMVIQPGLLIGFVGMNELIVILVIVLILFGAKKLPQLMRGMGQGIKEFKSAVNEGDKETESVDANSDPAEHEQLKEKDIE